MANPLDAGLPTPGFISVTFDVPFPISVPDDHYRTYDPKKGIAVVTVVAKQGARAFFRTGQLEGPRGADAQQQPALPPRPRASRKYVMVSRVTGGPEIPTLNINTGPDGGFVEAKFYSEVTVTYLADDVGLVSQQGPVFERACEILNPFLDKYRVMNQDYRISSVSIERNFYFAQCHTSPLEPDELNLDVNALFGALETGRCFNMELGHGAANVVRANSYELLGPRSPLTGQVGELFRNFAIEKYDLPLSYALVLEAIASLQRFRDYRLAIIHAETAVEVHGLRLLIRLMLHYGKAQIEIDNLLENDRAYWGVKNKLRQLDAWTQRHSQAVGQPYQAFVGSAAYNSWESDLYAKRNAAVHTGANAFTYDEASAAIHAAKGCIRTFETRCSGFADKVVMDPSMAGFRLNAGEVMF